MTRCRDSLAWALALFMLLLALWPASVPAQGLLFRKFPPDALRGTLQVVQPPEVLVNERPARLAPGARIRGQNNLLVLSGTLVGQPQRVIYTRDPYGLVMDVWILRPDELDRLWPTSAREAANWKFDAESHTWEQR